MSNESIEEKIESAYWDFDARRNGYGDLAGCPQSERDAYKQSLRVFWHEALKASINEAEHSAGFGLRISRWLRR